MVRKLAALLLMSLLAVVGARASNVTVTAGACIFGPTRLGPESCNGAVVGTDALNQTVVAAGAAPPLLGTTLDVIANASGGATYGDLFGEIDFTVSSGSASADSLGAFKAEANAQYFGSVSDVVHVNGQGPISLQIYAPFTDSRLFDPSICANCQGGGGAKS
jgi:hypothetical protein